MSLLQRRQFLQTATALWGSSYLFPLLGNEQPAPVFLEQRDSSRTASC